VCTLTLGTGNQIRMKIPGVHHHPTCVRTLHQHADFFVIGFGLGERVVQRNVDLILQWLVGIDFRHHDAVAVAIEHVGHAQHHHVVVVDQRDPDGSAIRGAGHKVDNNLLRGVPHPP
jgi:hypothetical protein